MRCVAWFSEAQGARASVRQSSRRQTRLHKESRFSPKVWRLNAPLRRSRGAVAAPHRQRPAPRPGRSSSPSRPRRPPSSGARREGHPCLRRRTPAMSGRGRPCSARLAAATSSSGPAAPPPSLLQGIVIFPGTSYGLVPQQAEWRESRDGNDDRRSDIPSKEASRQMYVPSQPPRTRSESRQTSQMRPSLRAAQQKKDAVRAYELVYAALGA
ncbi:MAG: hypothetical protein QOD43_810 [Gaiellaceae bacterium]|nr:hypothetical protein [Gaiellaceae bacterium]